MKDRFHTIQSEDRINGNAQERYKKGHFFSNCLY